MKVLSIQNYYFPNKISYGKFQKNNHCLYKTNPYQDEFTDSFCYWQGRHDEVSEEITADFSSFDNNIGHKVITGPLANTKIDSLRLIGNNTYKGGMASATNYIKEIKDSGIEKMIILCNPEECNIVEACNKNNMPWTGMYVPLDMNSDIGKMTFFEKFGYANFIDVINSLRNGNLFIGCEGGNLRTKRFLQAVKILDPQCKLDLGSSEAQHYDYVLAGWIYLLLSPVEKNLLGYTKQFEQTLISKLKQYVPKIIR